MAASWVRAHTRLGCSSMPLLPMSDLSIRIRAPSYHGTMLRGGLSDCSNPTCPDPPPSSPKAPNSWRVRVSVGFLLRSPLGCPWTT